MTVNHPHAMFRTGTRVYKSRPPANCGTARKAWDILMAANPDNPLKDMMLIEGYWMCELQDGTHDDMENTVSSRYK